MERITTKDICNLLKVSTSTAERLRKDIKQHYKPKSNIITKSHLIDYLNIPNHD